MNLQRKELSQAVAIAAKIVAKRRMQPILSCVKIEFDDAGAKLTATDLDTWYEARLPGGPTGTYAAVCIDAKQLLQVLKSRKDNLVLIASQGNAAFVDGLKVESYDADDYPRFTPAGADADQSAVMAASELQRIIDRTAWAAANYDPTTVLAGVYFSANQAVATDGSRLSLVNNIEQQGSVEALVPASVLIKAVQPLLKAAIKAKQDVTLTCEQCMSRKSLVIAGDGWKLATRLIAGEYPRYRELIPAASPKFITFPKEALLASLAQIAPFTDKRTHLITVDAFAGRLKTGEQSLELEAELSAALESAADDYPLVKWSCNIGHLRQAVESIPGDKIQVQYEAPLKPLVFIDGDYRHLLMPHESSEVKADLKAYDAHKLRLAAAS